MIDNGNYSDYLLHNAYELLENINNAIKVFKRQIRNDENELKEIYEEYKNLKCEYEQLILSYIGNGKYSEIMQKPAMIESRIKNLSNGNDYSEKLDQMKKIEAQKLIPVLREDLDNAIDEKEKLQKHSDEVQNSYNLSKEKLKNARIKLRRDKKELKVLQIRVKNILRDIRTIERRDRLNIKIPKKLSNKYTKGAN